MRIEKVALKAKKIFNFWDLINKNRLKISLSSPVGRGSEYFAGNRENEGQERGEGAFAAKMGRKKAAIAPLTRERLTLSEPHIIF